MDSPDQERGLSGIVRSQQSPRDRRTADLHVVVIENIEPVLP